MIRSAPSSMRSCTAVAVCAAWRYESQVLIATRTGSGTSSHARSCSRRLLGTAALEQVPQAAQRDERRVARLELPAQPRDVDLDRVERGGLRDGEQAARDRLLAYGLALLEHQRLEHRTLARRQRQRFLQDREEPRVAVIAQRAAFEDRVRALIGASQDRADTRVELAY